MKPEATIRELTAESMAKYLGEQCPGCGRYFLTLSDLAHAVRGTQDKANGEMSIWHRECMTLENIAQA